MTGSQWTRAQPVLTRALFLSPEEQQAAIESAFVDEDIRHELLQLLRRATSALSPLVLPEPAVTPELVDAVSGPPGAAPPAAPMLAAGQAVADGRFVVVRQLGRGGMGEVYLAHDRRLDNLVALKVLYDVEMREAQHARLCSGHSHIVTMYDSFEVMVGERARTVMVIEYINGRPASALVEDGRVGLRDAVRWAAQVASAMQHAHERGVLHCDLKPANILITPEEGAKVLDFGIGRATFERVNPLERLRGTAPYMAPEQLLERQFSPAGDVYSLGVTLFELVTGRLPFEGSTPEVMLQIVGAPPPRPSSIVAAVPPRLDEVLLRALAKDPRDRYRTARALATALEAVELELQAVPSSAAAMPVPSPARLRAQRYLALAGQTLGVAAASGLLTAWTFNLMIDRPRAFDPDSIVRQVVLGFQSLLLPAAMASVTLGVVAAVQLAGRYAFRYGVPAASRARAEAIAGRHRGEIVGGLAAAVIAGGVIAVLAVFVEFREITDAFGTRVSVADPESLAPLRPANRDRQVLYRLAVPMLLILGVTGWRTVSRLAAQGGTPLPLGVHAAAAGLVVLLFILSQAPYKALTEHSARPVVLVEAQRCYLLGERGGEARVYCPSWETPRVRTVTRAALAIRDCGFEESVFAGTVTTGCQPASTADATTD
jgi:hypothetical protein